MAKGLTPRASKTLYYPLFYLFLYQILAIEIMTAIFHNFQHRFVFISISLLLILLLLFCLKLGEFYFKFYRQQKAIDNNNFLFLASLLLSMGLTLRFLAFYISPAMADFLSRQDYGLPIFSFTDHLPYFLFQTRTQWQSIINNNFSPERARLISALILGERENLFRFSRLFRQAGASHLLALSGLHVSFIALFINFIISRIPFAKNWAREFNIAALIFYVFLAGASPSLQRAGIMLICWIMLQKNNKATSPLNILGLAGIIILFINPGHLYQLNFQLSFIVVISLIVFRPLLNRLIFNALAVSLAATIGTAPILLWHFGELNFNAIISNLILVPQMAIILPCTLLMILTSYFSQFLAAALAYLVNLLLTPFILSTAFLAELPFIISFDFYRQFAERELWQNSFLPLPVLLAYFIIFHVPTLLLRVTIPDWIRKRHGLSRLIILLIIIFLFIIIFITSISGL